ncbi:acyl-coenzyme A diphosphatase FITM2 isoform X1 [Anopheles bellator]|uniref:acyl-coenzyme A diphosphatase FITM2 isoform X1 n=1 Tax=Anopheles bellator TaxID=139047 RepID=UPI00264A30F8|nr:acyl-coenzyme A diphosphatase FITM2 isoform X1 [Anopheles bellator]XP_058053510.1 acyl-coenzyme A diphosphatase FITM2 isoform X1 [Anopheles bellator]
MATKRKPIHTPSNAANASRPQMNFRQGLNDTTARSEAKGTRPTATPTSIKEVLTMMVLHVCKKIIFFDTGLKVALYLGSLFIVSLIGDFLPYPKTYLARTDNLFNVYFVKMGWAWTLLFSFPYLAMTSVTLCCGDNQRLLRNHLPRLGIASVVWFVWTKLFNVIESSYGRCSIRGFDSKTACLKAGHFWNGFDISGHAFILIYSSLVLMEEARPIIGWESIKDLLRNEEHNRSSNDTSQSANPLKGLKDEDLKALKYFYNRFTPTIRLLFVGMTMLQLLWDVMLVGTMLYHHRMVEKVLSGIIAVVSWFVTYRAWYPVPTVLPDPVGKGMFNYQTNVKPELVGLRRRASFLQPGSSSTSASGAGGTSSNSKDIPKFMGMPLYGARHPYSTSNVGGATSPLEPSLGSQASFGSNSQQHLFGSRVGTSGGISSSSNYVNPDFNHPSYARYRSRFERFES